VFTYVWIALAILAGGMAHRKGRGPVVWFLLSWAITPVLALALILWKPPYADGLARRRFARGERRCPACRAFAPRTATTCPACHATLPPVPGSPSVPFRVPAQLPNCGVCGASAFGTSANPAFFRCYECSQDYEVTPPAEPKEGRA
jgi:hypothetical protein